MSRPFLYVGSGIAAARKAMECWVCFREDVPEAERAHLEAGVPRVLAGYFRWFDRVLVFGHGDDSLQWAVRAAYDHVEDEEHDPGPELPSTAMWRAFNDELDAWLHQVHAEHPVALFIKPIDEEYSTDVDEWHAWSCERIPTEALPIVEALGKPHQGVATYLAQMWRTWAKLQPFARQQELVAALSDEARARLKARKALFTPKPAPPEPVLPTLEQAEELWRQAADALEPQPRGLRLEDAFELALHARGFDREHSLINHLVALIEAGRHGDAIELARAALASGVEFPTHWYGRLIDSLVALGRVHEAAFEMPFLVAALESYHPEMLVSAMGFHRAANEPAVEAMLFHAGKTWFSTFTYHFTKAESKRFGDKPKDLATQFAAWFIGWCGIHLVPVTQPRLGHFLVWFKEVGVKAFGDFPARFEQERDHRVKLRAALDDAPDEEAAHALITELLPSADTEDASRAFHRIRERAPLAAYRYLLGTLRNERRNFYRYASGQRVDAVVSAMYLTLNVPELAEKLEEAYAIGRGYTLVNNAALHFNLACCAARLGERAQALEHVARALALNWPNPQQIHDDNDLASLRGDPAFEAIFEADATRRATSKPASDEDDEDNGGYYEDDEDDYEEEEEEEEEEEDDDAKAKTATKAKTKPATKAKPAVKAKSKTATKAKTKPATKAKPKPATKAKSKTATKAKPAIKAKSKTATKAKPKPKPTTRTKRAKPSR
ncbi:MAG: hypothetical protein R3B48_21400 [Kofleriaceae bacterium]